ncbi:MAG TPA: hypothetical protein VKP65_04500 [Rhodothermales bacterium]|nr:hypothetical protein [Rhodothermales bacterium]
MQHRPVATRFSFFLRAGMLLLLVVLIAVPAEAQNQKRVTKHALPTFYRSARFKKLLRDIYEKQGMRVVAQPYVELTSSQDSMLAWMWTMHPNYVEEVPPPEPLTITSTKVIKRNERFRYNKHFNEEVKWAYLGNNYYTALDTMFTRQIRARMQAKYGAPTKTLAELDFTRNLKQEEYIQFEYWFVLNDSIPVIVMDVHGPFDRGVVVATDHKYRDELYILREAFLEPLLEDGRLAPYVDYYYNYRARHWYRTGFDGRQFFTDSIGQPNLARGRPVLPSQGN